MSNSYFSLNYKYKKKEFTPNRRTYLTLEVKGRQVVQARKSCNKAPSKKDTEFINTWVKDKGLIKVI